MILSRSVVKIGMLNCDDGEWKELPGFEGGGYCLEALCPHPPVLQVVECSTQGQREGGLKEARAQ